MNSFFKLQERGTTVSREIIGGITTFLAMAYILALNPTILADSGMNWDSVFTATAISSAIATLVMAFCANLPVALAPGLGLNAFFTYTVVIGMGCTWQFALTAVLLEGILFIILSVFGIREAIINSIPAGMKKAVSVGIGLFITIIGLSNAGIVGTDTGTLIGFHNLNMDHSTALVAVIGLIITVILYINKVPGSILIAIAATTIIGIPFGVTKVPEAWKPISLPAAPYFFKFEFANILSVKFLVVFITFLFTDLFDTLGTLMGIAEQADLKDEDGNISNAKGALLSDAVGTVVGDTNHSIEFCDNRLSRFVASKGKCELSKVSLAFEDVECIYLNPPSQGGTDEYANLRIVHKDIKSLIYSNDVKIIKSLIDLFDCRVPAKIAKLNKWRAKAGLEAINLITINQTLK